MALQAIMNINVDFYEKKYILINAKQNDKKSRFLSVTCYNNGDIFPINSGEHAAYIRYKKFDNNSVFNFCEINSKGKILVELTEQMLAVEGICSAELVLVNKGSAKVDTNTGEIIGINNTGILSTMTFYIDVSETVVDNSEIESSYEFNGLNEALERAEAEYEEVARLAKSYAVGDAGGIRANEDTDNAKYYSSLASSSQKSAATSATNAANSASKAASSETKAATSATNASTYATRASNSAANAANSAASASTSATNAQNYATNAQNSMNSAATSANTASTGAANAEYYYNKFLEMIDTMNGTFLPMGTVEFSELATLVANGTVQTGFLYNISDDFVTDNSFKEGAGVEYPAGTNVYFTADDFWDCLTGASVNGIKGSNESVYRKGNVDITAENVGAVSTSDVATTDEVLNYLSIS